MTVWSRAQYTFAEDVLRKSQTVGVAISRMRSRYPSMTLDSVTNAFRRSGRKPVGSYLLTPPDATPVEPDPLQAACDARAKHADDRSDRQALKKALDRMSVLEKQLDLISRPCSAPLGDIVIPHFATGARRPATAVAMLSDVHAGANVRLCASSYGNRYSPEICRFRVKRFFSGLRWMIEGQRAQCFDIHDLVLSFTGDMIDNQLHDDQKETSQSAIETVDWLEPLLIAGVRDLLELDVRIKLVCSFGNHGRDTIKPRRGTGAEHSYEWGMYQRIGRALEPLSVETLADRDAHQYVEVYGKTLHFTHGDECKYNGGVGGISIPLNKAFAQWHKVRPTYLHHCGHYHTRLDGGWWLANGSVKGYDPFAMSVKGDPQPPEQLFYLLDAKRGKTAVSPIWVSSPGEEAGLP
jgi:hypothetical protein